MHPVLEMTRGPADSFCLPLCPSLTMYLYSPMLARFSSLAVFWEPHSTYHGLNPTHPLTQYSFTSTIHGMKEVGVRVDLCLW